MKNKIKLLLVDGNQELLSQMNMFFTNKGDTEVVAKATDGIDAAEKIRTLMPDVVLMDIVIPGMDGIGLLKKIGSLPLSRRPVVIVLTGAKKDNVTNLCMELGADYFMIKPCEFETIYERIHLLCTPRASLAGGRVNGTDASGKGDRPSDRAIEISVTNTIHSVGVPANIKGYQYLRDAIIMSIKDTELINAVTKQLYPKDSKGQFEGIWILFFVLIPMIGGSLIGEAVVKTSGETFVDAASGQTQYIPNGNIFFVGAAVIILTVIPAVFAAKSFKKRMAEGSK